MKSSEAPCYVGITNITGNRRDGGEGKISAIGLLGGKYEESFTTDLVVIAKQEPSVTDKRSWLTKKLAPRFALTVQNGEEQTIWKGETTAITLNQALNSKVVDVFERSSR